MELGNQIRVLRTQRGVTQEALAEHLNVSPQAVSKWERDAALPDIQLLPALSAYFGVTIDALFSLTDDTRMERIENMLNDERFLDEAVVERERAFLLEKARREPGNGRPLAILAALENTLAERHQERAAEYAKEALLRDPVSRDAHSDLVRAMGGRLADWCCANHRELIGWYQAFLEKNPENRGGYMWLIDQLIDDGRLEEARKYLARMEAVDGTYRTPLYHGLIAWADGDKAGAMAVWEQMGRDWPEEWGVWLSLGDVMARTGQYERAKGYYRKAYELQPPLKYMDGLDSIAQVCELAGDIPGAVAAREEQIAALGTYWNIHTGEMIDKGRREIERASIKQNRGCRTIQNVWQPLFFSDSGMLYFNPWYSCQPGMLQSMGFSPCSARKAFT